MEPSAPQAPPAATEAPKQETAPPSVTKSRWRSVPEEEEVGQVKFNPYLADSAETQDQGEDVDGEELEEDLDGEPMEEDDEDVDGEPMLEDEEGEADGEPMAEDDEDDHKESDEEVDMFVKDEDIQSESSPKKEEPAVSGVTLGSGFGFKIGGFGAKTPSSGGIGSAERGRKKRMTAEDMFDPNDSDA